MKLLRISGASLAVSLVLAACGGGGGSPDAPASSGRGQTVAVKSIDGVGDVLVDSSGKALYAADAEADGKVKCVGACESFWKPLTVASAMPTAPSGVGGLSVIKRPDGSRQVTVDGKLLYTFTDDSAGQVKGIGFEDDFNGQHFTWNAVLATGAFATRSERDSSGAPSGGGDGY